MLMSGLLKLRRFAGAATIQTAMRTCSQNPFADAVKKPNTTHNEGIEADLKIEAELFESSYKYSPVSAENLLRKNKIVANKKLPQLPTMTATKSQKVRKPPKLIDDPKLGLQFYRLSLGDPELITLMTMARSRKRRDKNCEIVLEGRRLISEALQCQLTMRALIFSQTDQLQQLANEVAEAQKTMNTKIYKVPQHDLKMWSTLTTPPGLMAIFKRPSEKGIIHNLHKSSTLPITVICDNIREPNNLGSIIRSCAAIPCSQVIVMRGCCDPWESKALRGGCGGQFRMPILDDVDWEGLHDLFSSNENIADCRIFVAENNLRKATNKATIASYTDLGTVGTQNIVIIGGESQGVSDDAYRFMESMGQNSGKCLHIPLANGIESLNVASAITLILYELRRHLLKTQN